MTAEKDGGRTAKTIQILAAELGAAPAHVANVVQLLDEGNTIPFIARYRKEMHGAMDDTALRTLEERLQYLRSLDERRETVLRSIEEQGKLTEELAAAVEEAKTLAELEDLYRPYKQKKRTRASIAKEKGLEPLAFRILLQGKETPEALARDFLDPEKGVETIEDALAGASDIIAEIQSDDADNRKILREYMGSHGMMRVRAAGEEDSVYRTYYEFDRALSKMQGHQTLAVNRGEKEGFLKVSLELDDGEARELLARRVIARTSPCGPFLRNACADAWDRLIRPSLEREMRSTLTEAADEGAIHNFALNLKPLLMQPPVKGSVVMGLDPGYRNGCKVAVVDATGRVLDTAVVYPTFSEARRQEAIRVLSAMARRHRVRHFAIGNGTASRETESMASDMIRGLNAAAKSPEEKGSYAIVNEAGASVYSASELAAKEFPDFDVNLRSAVSIARRLQDPLAELVKIDPMAIGVGQYQHDMPQSRLREALEAVVEDCVNAVGVDINTASQPLLQQVAGLTKTTSANIVAYREENGAFTSRAQIKKVPKLGPKAFEQCAGFLRVPESRDPLDNTAVHPESYEAAKKLLALCGFSKEDLKKGGLPGMVRTVEKLGAKQLAEQCGVGVPTLMDIAAELAKPGRDPREELPPVVLRSDVLEMSDLKPGMKLKGTVRNVIDFGAFVDIGVHQDGLVHISQIADRFLRHPSEVLSVGDIVDVVVLEVDPAKKRISLSIKQAK